MGGFRVNVGWALALWMALFVGGSAQADDWTVAFAASPAAYALGEPLQGVVRTAMAHPVTGTLRVAVTLATGGSAVRVRLSNEDGDRPLKIQAATVALAGDQLGSTSGAIMALTFHGKTSITIPTGAPALSDPVPLSTKSFDRLAISTYLPDGLAIVPFGGGGMSAAPGDQTGVATLQNARSVVGRPVVSAVAVATDRPFALVVAFGDSLTDGLRPKPGPHGYPEELARRFAAAPAAQRHAVVNAGIGGNRVLVTGWGDNALARLDRDVLRLPGVSHMILLEGINDIGMRGPAPWGSGAPVSADDLIAGYRQIIARAHGRGIKVIGGTLLPFKGARYFSAEGDEVRQAVNQWIRSSGEFDGVIDFEAAVRDPTDPAKYRADLDSGDHLHPNDAGYKAMGDAIDLSLFR
jgi:lysophospholipase L1-like esterase